ncbi:protein kinase [Trypanosoma rangeli]|uniref:Protein kinase n=1 Tax=Trypanosoma rangeli TaxID=5698 RepID=A0A3S5IQV1_TRYRA|nr:protein kinase [Trypanosoma rangeli]RNF02550.1 protein kinase [Trypanosoma rangeli]|eukprot:RNF02550.1 protein kinase [Trypanosoma rangeli]
MSTVNRLRCLEKLGEGTYGVVFKAKENATGHIVAVKRMVISGDDEGAPATAIREVCLLKELKHNNIVALRDVLFDPPKVTLIFEYCQYDLKKYMEQHGNRKKVTVLQETQQIMKQMLLGLRYMHRRHVVHRDLKPENIFINIDRAAEGTGNVAVEAAAAPALEKGATSPPAQAEVCGSGGKQLATDSGANNAADASDAAQLIVKLGDFGLARVENIPVKKYSHDVVSLWYRGPDVMMGTALYGFAVDMWSVGCIFAEMITQKPLLNGRTEVEQLLKIFCLLGTPTLETWPSLPSYPKCRQMIDAMTKLARERLVAVGPNAKEQQQQQQQTKGSQAVQRCKEHPCGVERRGGDIFVTGQHLRRPFNSANSSNSSGFQELLRNDYNFPPELCFRRTLDDYLEKSRFREIAGEEGIDLLRKLLCYEPSYRLTAHEALLHPFLKNVKAPVQRKVDMMCAMLRQTLEEHRLLDVCGVE